jgi:hypothetical protein
MCLVLMKEAVKHISLLLVGSLESERKVEPKVTRLKLRDSSFSMRIVTCLL